MSAPIYDAMMFWLLLALAIVLMAWGMYYGDAW